MTASQLISEIFSRVQDGIAPNMRRLTTKQLNLLSVLIFQEQEAGNGRVKTGDGGSLVWTPGGRDRYVLTEGATSGKHTITRLASLAPVGVGRLFPDDKFFGTAKSVVSCQLSSGCTTGGKRWNDEG